MKEKIFTVNSIGDFYVLEEIDYQNKKYVLCGKCDIDDDVDVEELELFEVNLDNDELVVNNVDDNIADIVTTMILNKFYSDK